MARRANGEDYGGKVLRGAMDDVGGTTIDADTASEAIQAALESLKKQALLLKDADYSKLDPKSLSQTLAYTAKMVDEVTRLLEFAQGRADSRPDLGLQSFLEVLSDEQVRILETWVKEGQTRKLAS